MSKQSTLFSISIFALALLILTGCARTAPTTVPTPNLFNLANSTWTLTAMTRDGANVLLVAQKPTLEFQSDTLGGSAGCNSYSGDYKTQGEIIQVGALRSTLMACADENAMAQESAYLDALQNARMFELRDNVLKILYGAGKGQLVFARAGN